ncbi:cell division protein FtsL [Roseomonas populi]|uniref:Cell division protein FtsL n=1 Tax=Roseomonas populi TaxID=3121582 RepID=A0ABT1X9G3_9PROT|nr:hypothetical protein [Roseomonas pecuniae]MCR0984745.1 hypothetical protein [Roseomonas pecuniae]
MIRPLTFLSLVAAAGAGLHLYSVKHDVSQLEKVLRETVKQTEAARERTAVLRAEWAMLNEPERLRAAATRVLPLEVMQTAQFVRPTEMDRRLPAAVAFAGAPSLFAPAPGERGGAAGNVAVASAVGVPAIAAQASMAVASAAVASAAVASAALAAPAAMAAAPAAGGDLLAALPLPPDAPPPAPPARPAPAALAAPERPAAPAVVAERAPVERSAPERSVAERPARVAPPHLPQVASARVPEPREAAPRSSEMARAETSRAPRPPRPAEPRLAEREVDRGMNLAEPPQRPALLRTALHMRPSAPPPPAPVAPPMAAGMGSMLGAAARPMLAPPVPVASANAGTLGAVR